MAFTRDNKDKKDGRGPRIKFQKPRCRLCRSKAEINYKNTELLQQFVSSNGKIIPSGRSGNCAKHQRLVNRAVKRARNIAFMPFVR